MAIADSWADGAGTLNKNAARERAVLLTLAAVQFTSIIDFMVIMPLGPQLKRTMGITPAQFGYIVSSYTIAAGIAGFIASSLIDRFSRKVAFLGLFVGFLVGTLLCGLAPTYPLLLVARVVTGTFGGVLGGLAMAIVGDVFPDERRGRATGVLMSAFSLASVFGVPFGLFLGTRYGWHYPFLMLVAVGVPILVMGIVVLPPLRDHLTRVHADPWERMVETYSHPNHLRAFALVVSVMLGTFMVVPFISPYLVFNSGLTENDLPWIYFGGGVCSSLITSPIIGQVGGSLHGKLRVYPDRIAPVLRPDDAGPDEHAQGPDNSFGRGRGGLAPDGQQRRSDGRGAGDDQRQRRAAPARRFHERLFLGPAHFRRDQARPIPGRVVIRRRSPGRDAFPALQHVSG